MSLLMKTLKEDDAIIIIRYVVPGLELDIWPNIFQCENIFDKKFPFWLNRFILLRHMAHVRHLFYNKKHTNFKQLNAHSLHERKLKAMIVQQEQKYSN